MKFRLIFPLLCVALIGCATVKPRPADVPVPVGQKAPGGTVIANNGSKVELSSLYDGRRAIVVFYRGHW